MKTKQDSHSQSDLLRYELDRIKLSDADFCRKARISHSSFSRKLHDKTDFNPMEKVFFGILIEQSGGDAQNVWPEFRKLIQIPRPDSKPLHDNHIGKFTDKSILIPGFEDCDLYLRTYDKNLQDIKPGSIVALKSIPVDQIISGNMYYLVLGSDQVFRKLTVTDNILAFHEGVYQAISKDKIEGVYSVRGWIMRL